MCIPENREYETEKMFENKEQTKTDNKFLKEARKKEKKEFISKQLFEKQLNRFL